jgi:hypothetical protein
LIEFIFPSEPISLSEPPNKIPHYEQLNEKKIRKSRHKSLAKISIENTTPNPPSSIVIDTTGIIISKKRSSAEIAAAAILSSNHMRKKRIQRKNSDETISNIKQESILINDASPDSINDELLKRLSQGKNNKNNKLKIIYLGI